MKRKLDGKVAVLTGAGRGIGRAVAIALAKEGASLVLAARTASELAQTKEMLAPCAAVALPTDVSDPKQSDALMAYAIKHFGELDILVNAAAIPGPIGPLWTLDLSAWHHAVSVNLLGTVYCCHAAVPYMIRRGRGKIINFSGGGATAPRPNFSAYAAAKAAVVRFTETLAEELKPWAIDVNAIAPGLVDTRLLDATAEAGTNAGMEGALVEALRAKGVGGVAAEVPASLAVFLACADSDGLSGRLISAPHDDWPQWDRRRIEELRAKPWLTLRRLDEYTLRSLNDAES